MSDRETELRALETRRRYLAALEAIGAELVAAARGARINAGTSSEMGLCPVCRWDFDRHPTSQETVVVHLAAHRIARLEGLPR